MHEAGGNEGIDKPIEFELANPIGIYFPRFITDYGDSQSVARLTPAMDPQKKFQSGLSHCTNYETVPYGTVCVGDPWSFLYREIKI
jgi:hypothetical protein